MPHRTYRVWLKGNPKRYVEWSGDCAQEAAIGALVHLTTSEERQSLPPETVICASRAVSFTVADIHRWIDGLPTQMEHEKSRKTWMRSHLTGTF